MKGSSEQKLIVGMLSNAKDCLTRRSPMATALGCPPGIAPLEASADITDRCQEAVEMFPQCLLVTDPIPSDDTENYMAKEVVFNIKSNDQGWCNDDNFEGEYAEGPSQTWFEVAILRPVKEDVKISPNRRDKLSVTSQPFIKKYLDEKGIPKKQQFVVNPQGGLFWYLQRNRRGNEEAFVHTVIWTRYCKALKDERLQVDAKTGAGSGVDFVRSLQGGDRVAIIARAKQSGSINYVSAAKIQIFFEGSILASNPGSTASSIDELATQSDIIHASPSSSLASRKESAHLWAALQLSKVAKSARAARVTRVAQAAKKVMKAARAAKVAKFMKAVHTAKVMKSAKAVKPATL